MAERLQEIEALPAQYGSIAASFRRVARRLARASAASSLGAVLPVGVPPLSTLPSNVTVRGGLSTRLYITREENRLLFGFIRGRTQTDILMDTKISFRVAVADRDFPPPPLQPESVVHFAAVPPFLTDDLTLSEKSAAAKTLSAKVQEALFLTLDFGTLAIAEPEDFNRARVAWRKPGSSDWALMVTPLIAVPGVRRTWQVPPFLALSRTIGVWTRSGFGAGAPRVVKLPAALDVSSEKAAFYVLRQLVAAWIEAVNQIGNREGDAENLGPGVRELVPDYDIDDYEARVLLRLDAAAQLARKGDREDLFQLQATLRLEEDAAGVPKSRITIGPPDFLSAGRLYEAFLVTLEQDGALAKLAQELGIRGQSGAVRDFLGSARASEHEAPLVFRVRQGERDQDLITLHGTLNGLLQHVVVKAAFQVETGDEPRVTLDEDSIELLYTDRPRDGHPPPERGEELIRYFLRLAMHLRHWQGAIG